jgi:hypothetical protein
MMSSISSRDRPWKSMFGWMVTVSLKCHLGPVRGIAGLSGGGKRRLCVAWMSSIRSNCRIDNPPSGYGACSTEFDNLETQDDPVKAPDLKYVVVLEHDRVSQTNAIDIHTVGAVQIAEDVFTG